MQRSWLSCAKSDYSISKIGQLIVGSRMRKQTAGEQSPSPSGSPLYTKGPLVRCAADSAAKDCKHPSGKIGDFATSPYRGGFAHPICALHQSSP